MLEMSQAKWEEAAFVLLQVDQDTGGQSEAGGVSVAWPQGRAIVIAPGHCEPLPGLGDPRCVQDLGGSQLDRKLGAER